MLASQNPLQAVFSIQVSQLKPKVGTESGRTGLTQQTADLLKTPRSSAGRDGPFADDGGDSWCPGGSKPKSGVRAQGFGYNQTVLNVLGDGVIAERFSKCSKLGKRFTASRSL